MESLAIIPARGGSKGIPQKNIKLLGKHPLIYYSIRNAIDSKNVNRLIVSTDDIKIAKIAENLGAEIPFLRPKSLSKNNSSTIDVIKHAVHKLQKTQNYFPDIVTILQPTTPFRTSQMLNDSINLLIKTKSDIVLGVSEIKNHPYRSFTLQNKFLKPLNKNFLKFHQRQLFPKSYYPTGMIYTFWTKNLEKFGHMYGPKIFPLLLTDNSRWIDIDSLHDFFVAEMTLKYIGINTINPITLLR